MAVDPFQSAGPGSGATPPEPRPPEPRWWVEDGGAADSGDPLFSPHQHTWKRDSLERELAACREELEAMQALLHDLPQIFEGKFEARLQPLLEQKQRLLEGNQGLRRQLHQLQPASEALAGRLMPAADPPSPAASRRQAWGRNLRQAFGLGQR